LQNVAILTLNKSSGHDPVSRISFAIVDYVRFTDGGQASQ